MDTTTPTLLDLYARPHYGSLTITFKFYINQVVHIDALSLNGVVLGRADRGPWLEYRISYWNNGSIHDEWIPETFLSAKV